MPTLTAVEIPASQVTVKDTMIHLGTTYTVADVDRKPVWVYISYIDGTKPLRIKGDEVVTVERMVRSDEEIAIEKREMYNEFIARHSVDADADFAKALERVGQGPSWDAMEALVKARRMQELYATVSRCASHLEVDLVAAMEKIRAEEADRLLDVSFAHTSTSLMGTAIDGNRHAATQEFIRRYRGW
jgi:hypothetical protein